MKKIEHLLLLVCTFLATIIIHVPANATQFSLSPMFQFVSLSPGEEYTGNFEIVNPGDSEYDFYYKISVQPFSVDNNDEISLTENGDYNQIVNWIELSNTEGTISPNEHREIRFTINVPENSPAGGQYASIVVSSGEHKVNDDTIDLREIYQATHLIYADIAGDTVRKGSIGDLIVPSFMFSGTIKGSAALTNEGNVHSKATQTLQVFPLFSKEEVFTNEENPKETWVLPENTLASSVEWKDTPSKGIFHVIYNVEYEGVKKTVDKYVIICPLWLLFIVLALIALIIIKIIFSRKKERK